MSVSAALSDRLTYDVATRENVFHLKINSYDADIHQPFLDSGWPVQHHGSITAERASSQMAKRMQIVKSGHRFQRWNICPNVCVVEFERAF